MSELSLNIVTSAMLLIVVLATASRTEKEGIPAPFPGTSPSDLSGAASDLRRTGKHQFRPPPLPRPDVAITKERSEDELTELVRDHMIDFSKRVRDHIRSSSTTSNDEYLDKSPQYMVDLYRQKAAQVGFTSSTINRKQNKALRRSDVVRGFAITETYLESKKLSLVFDASAILDDEHIRLVELQVELLPLYRNVTTVELWVERVVIRNKITSLNRRQIGTFSFEVKSHLRAKRMTVGITRMFRRWYNSYLRGDDYNRKLALYDTGLARSKRSLSSADWTNMVFVYSTNKELNLESVAASRQSRHRRSSKRSQAKRRRYEKRRKAKLRNRNSKKINKTSKSRKKIDQLFHASIKSKVNQRPINIQYNNDVEYDDTSFQFLGKPNQNNDVDLWVKEQSESRRPVKPKAVATTPKVPPTFKPPYSIYSPEEMKTFHCRVVYHEINFIKIGWDEWIIHPKQYNAGRCVGHCRAPIIQHSGRPSNHAYMQSLMATFMPDSGISQPCCVPTKYHSLSVLYYEKGYMVQREHEDMIVAECGCR